MTTNEAKKMKGKDPCWDGYKMLGTKPKGGKQVPNCIPEEVMDENIARLVSNSIKRATAVKPTPQQKANMRMNREETESKGHHEEAEEHLSKANDAEARGDKMAYHHHMADHHDSMSQWHEEKGRSDSADKHAEKADMHSDKYTQHARGMSEESIAEVTKQSAIKQYKDIQSYKPAKAKPDNEKKEFIKITMRRGNTKVSEDKDPGEYDQEGDMAMTQLRSIIHHAQQLHDQLGENDNLPEWVQNKITLAQDYMQTAHDYMYSQKNEEVVAEGLSEMDKSQTPPGRDGSNDSDAGKKEYTAKATTAKKVAKDAEKILNKELNKKQGVAEEVKLDEISTKTQAAYSKASHKDRMNHAGNLAASTGHDKEAAQKLKVRNAGLKRISDRIYDKTPKVTPAPKPKTPLENDYGYGKGRYMGDSVEMKGNKIDELSPSTLSSYKKAAGQSASNLDKSADKEFALGNKTAGVALTNKANKRFSGIVRATKKQ
jgi:hypothetical protein